MAEIFRLLFAKIHEHLTENDLAILARVSHAVNEQVIPHLYHTVRLHSPGRIDTDDRLMAKLDALGDPRFNKLQYTRRVIVSGSWYNTYADIDSELGPHRILSPAARMFNNIIRNCVIRMPNLEEFIWDMQVSLTQALVTAVLVQPRLRSLWLRMGTNCTPKPFFRPSLAFQPHVRMTELNLIQVDDEPVLRSLGSALRMATQLQQLSIWADDRARLSVGALFQDWQEPAPFHLNSLDIRGFVDLGASADRFWATFNPRKLRRLTLQIVPQGHAEWVEDFWAYSIQAGVRPDRVVLNLGIQGLENYLSSFSGLEAFQLLPSDFERPTEPLPRVIGALSSQHSATLRGLGLCKFADDPRYVLDVAMSEYLVRRLPGLQEVRFSQCVLNEAVVETILSLPRLRVLCLDPVDDEIGDDIQFLDSIMRHVKRGLAPNLKYVAFDDDTVYEISRDPIRISNRVSWMGYVRDTILLNERLFDWVTRSFFTRR
ncbi:hypothetical protein BDV25DRAFT_141488 [Aspergillus avenaceus]|uniref:F-box domain-containing protein n=1 Tax=Aspergillus avenaceus TaxID=36643 RepID=A0A5N6TQV8_ASPAV|nr:hypothetical protein BDV25DRAFT_141488 [Aspergillus avenaceus]